MKKRNLVMAVLAIITMGLAMPIGAQSSNQSTATAGVFSADADKFMNVNKYGDVEFDKWFGYLSSSIGLGYATKFGDIYLGGYYTGNIFRSGTYEAKTKTTTWDSTLQQLLTTADQTTYGTGTQATTNTNNSIEALVGIIGMGFKVGFWENITTYNTPYNTSRSNYGGTTTTVTQNADGSITYTDNDSINYEQSTKNLQPSIQWGMKLPLGSGTLLPRAGASVNFYSNTLIDEYYAMTTRTEINGKTSGAESITRVENNAGYVGLSINAGADYYFDNTFYVGIGYTLGTNLYSNDYSGAGKSGSVTGTVNTTTTSTTTDYFDSTRKDNSFSLSVSEMSNMSHSITPVVWKSIAVGDDLKLGVKFQLPITISNSTTSGYSDSYTRTETIKNDPNLSSQNTTTISESHTPGQKQETSTVSIAPSVGLGASYKLIPGKFTVNTGVLLNPITYSSTNTTTSSNGVYSTYNRTEVGSGDNKHTTSETTTVYPPGQSSNVTGNATISDSASNTTTWTGLSATLRGGFVFSFNDNVALDLLASTTGFTFNLTSLSVLFTFKF